MSKKEKGYLVVCDKKYFKALKKAYKKTKGADKVSKGVFNKEYLIDTFEAMAFADNQPTLDKTFVPTSNRVEFNPSCLPPDKDDLRLTVTIKHQDKSCALRPEYWIKVDGLDPLKFVLYEYAIEAISMYMKDKDSLLRIYNKD